MAVMQASEGTKLSFTEDKVDLNDPESLKNAKWKDVFEAGNPKSKRKKKDKK